MNKGMWKLITAVTLAGGAIIALKNKKLAEENKKYCEKIVELSNDIPNTKEQDEELAEIEKREEVLASEDTEE